MRNDNFRRGLRGLHGLKAGVLPQSGKKYG